MVVLHGIYLIIGTSMDKTFTCLIPYHRTDTIQEAIESAESDGWYVETKQDTRFAGVCKMREALLNDAFVNPDTRFIRYLDDDDIILPHKHVIARAFDSNPDVHIIYTDYLMNMPSGNQLHVNYTGNPIEDCIPIHPWSWIARVEALHKIKDVYGHLWDYTTPREGGHTWFNFLQLGANIMHIPIEAYQYNKSFDPSRISQQQGSNGLSSLEYKLKNLQKRIQ
jgi:hypothetical protein